MLSMGKKKKKKGVGLERVLINMIVSVINSE